MWTEKLFGFGESWLTVSIEALCYQQQVAGSTIGFWMTPWLLPHAAVNSTLVHAPLASERMLRKGMAPIHEKVLSNVRRLEQE